MIVRDHLEVPEWTDLRSSLQNHIIYFSKNQTQDGCEYFRSYVENQKFTILEKVYILCYLHRNNLFVDLDTSGLVPALYRHFNTWTEAWNVAFQIGVPYRGSNEVLRNAYMIMRD